MKKMTQRGADTYVHEVGLYMHSGRRHRSAVPCVATPEYGVMLDDCRAEGSDRIFVEGDDVSGLSPWLLLRGLLPIFCLELEPGERVVIKGSELERLCGLDRLNSSGLPTVHCLSPRDSYSITSWARQGPWWLDPLAIRSAVDGHGVTGLSDGCGLVDRVSSAGRSPGGDATLARATGRHRNASIPRSRSGRCGR